MKEFLFGLLAFSIITYSLFLCNLAVSPYNHFSLLEWVGIMGIGIIFKAGVDTYYKEATEH